MAGALVASWPAAPIVAARLLHKYGSGFDAAGTLAAMPCMMILGGAVTWRVHAMGSAVLDWQPSLGGWIAVLVAFVLARVFRLGTRMREELAGVV